MKAYLSPEKAQETMPRKRKTLPKDFKSLLESAPVDELIAVFDRCELDARDDSNRTALGFAQAPDGLIRWLVEQGLDVDSRNAYGETALASRAVVWRTPASQIPLFLSLGADIEARSDSGVTPLQLAVSRLADYAAGLLIQHDAATSGAGWNPTTMLEGALRGVQNASITQAAAMANLMVEQGAEATDSMRSSITEIGERFERYRSGFAPERIEATEAALNELYRKFEVASAPRRMCHDGATPIVMPVGAWNVQHAALWAMLVPGKGPAPTQQGEVIRIAGKVSDEMLRNGGGNWDSQFCALVDAAAEHMRSGNSLPEAASAELDAVLTGVRRGLGSESSLRTFTRLSVEWVALNPTPIPLGDVDYGR